MSENQPTEQQIYDQFIEKLKSGDDAAAKELLIGKFADGTDYAGETLLTYIWDNSSLDLFLFQAIHFACAQTFDEIKAKLSAIAEEDGSPNYFSAEEIYFEQLDQMSNLDDQALADKIANGMIPDLWPIPGDPWNFGVPSRTCDVPFDSNKLIYEELQNLSSMSETTLEVLVKVDVVPNGASGLNEGRERVSPEEFGDRSRNHESMTLVYNLES